MIGDTEFDLAVVPSARREDLLETWERFALPIVAGEARGGGTLPDRGSLLEIGGAELSSVRRVGGALEIRVWNPSSERMAASVAGDPFTLRPFEIRTISLPS
jgi:hypothetical protein